MVIETQILSNKIGIYKTMNKDSFLGYFSQKVIPTKFEKKYPNGGQYYDAKFNIRTVNKVLANWLIDWLIDL